MHPQQRRSTSRQGQQDHSSQDPHQLPTHYQIPPDLQQWQFQYQQYQQFIQQQQQFPQFQPPLYLPPPYLYMNQTDSDFQPMVYPPPFPYAYPPELHQTPHNKSSLLPPKGNYTTSNNNNTTLPKNISNSGKRRSQGDLSESVHPPHTHSTPHTKLDSPHSRSQRSHSTPQHPREQDQPTDSVDPRHFTNYLD